MKRKVLSFFLILAIILTNVVAFASPDEDIRSFDMGEEEALAEGESKELIVKFKETSKARDQKNFSKTFSIDKDDYYDLGNNSRVISVGDRDLDEFLEEIKQDPSIEYAEKNYTYKLFASPNDPDYYELWHMDNIYAEEAWDKYYSNRQVVVAVIDSGMDNTHRDLRNRYVRGGYDFLNNGAIYYDFDGHGTFVSGVIAAEMNNGYGIAGVSGSANIKILPLKVTDTKGNADNSDIIRAIDHAIDMGVDVINMSLGGPDYSWFFDDACQRAIDAGIVVVAAAGNEGDKNNQVNYPAAYAGVIGVGATDRYNDKASFSNANNAVDIVAPGESVYSTWTGGTFSYGNGTSYSAPMVAAAAAMIRGVYPGASVAEVRDILYSTAVDLGPNGKDIYYGHGLLHMERAIQEASLRANADDFINYELKNISREKEVKVVFNNPVSLESLGDSIYASTDARGMTSNLRIFIELDEEDERVVYIIPNSEWPESGYGFIFIDDTAEDVNGKSHRNVVRIVLKGV